MISKPPRQELKVSVNLPLAGLAFLLLMTLKLTHVIAWSWWWITLPLWGPFAFLLLFLAIAFVWVLVRK
jgi:hypothetical protein